MNDEQNIYQFNANALDGSQRQLEEFRGKVLLIFNAASLCGFTPHYQGLNQLYKDFRQQGLEVLGFPCNQFGKQEPGSSEDIQSFCDAKFRIQFPLFEKVDVKGEQAHPLFTYLSSALPGVLGSKAIKWNFTKFLIDRNGRPYKRYAPQTKPEDMRADIEQLLKQN
jgi:glutathione peroxidase